MPKPRTVRAIEPNAGVDAWYRSTLQRYVKEMADDALRVVCAAWNEASPDIGFASDAATILAAGVMFREPRGRILLLHRTDGEGWAFPAGGVDPGEDIEGAARREASEETGWSAGLPLHLLEVRQYRGVRFATFTCDVPEDFTPFLNDEHSEARWATPAYALRFFHLHAGVRATLNIHCGNANDWERRQIVAMDAMRRKVSPTTILQRALEKWGTMWRGRLDDLSLDLSKKFADKSFGATQSSMAAAFKSAGFTVKFKPTEAAREAYRAVVAENVNLIKSIPAQFLKDVQSSTWQAVMDGSDLAKLSQSIQKNYGVAYRRAALIARDQNAKAKAVIENTRRKELGIKEAIWQHSTAGKEPRPTHVAMNGKTYKLDRGMYDSAVKKHVWPGTEINCRCTSRAVLPGFD